MLSVMTLNVRREGVESADAHHFIHRRHRIAALFQRIQPTIIGTQEAFSSQVHALLPLLPTHYSVVGYEGEGHHGVELNDPIRRYDYRTAIWYDRRYFQLVASDHVWLSSTQQRDSRSWGSSAVRTMTLVVLRSLCAEQEELANENAPVLLVFNTHLDDGVELARYEQAKLVARIIAEWQLHGLWPRRFRSGTSTPSQGSVRTRPWCPPTQGNTLITPAPATLKCLSSATHGGRVIPPTGSTMLSHDVELKTFLPPSITGWATE